MVSSHPQRYAIYPLWQGAVRTNLSRSASHFQPFSGSPSLSRIVSPSTCLVDEQLWNSHRGITWDISIKVHHSQLHHVQVISPSRVQPARSSANEICPVKKSGHFTKVSAPQVCAQAQTLPAKSDIQPANIMKIQGQSSSWCCKPSSWRTQPFRRSFCHRACLTCLPAPREMSTLHPCLDMALDQFWKAFLWIGVLVNFLLVYSFG